MLTGPFHLAALSHQERVGLKKSTISDHSGKQLIHFIYERALRKFRCAAHMLSKEAVCLKP